MDTSRILVSGSSTATEAQLALARALGRRIIEQTQHAVITGGLAGRADGGSAVDCAVAAAAESACKARGDDVRQRIMTMLPAHDSRNLRRCEHGDVRRVEFADPRSRRYAMVLAADAVISIGGGVGTDSILELAWIAEKVMIPIPSSGGASAECWDRYGSHLNRRLRVRDDELNAVSSDASTVDDITRACLTILERHLRPRCFVAMAFGDKHPVPSAWEMYEAVLADRGFNPTRMDKQAVLGSVIQAIWTGIRQADVVIADISGWNANVFYELGIAHALTKPVIITVHSAEVGIPDGVPFDIADQRIVPYSSAGDLAGRIDGELKLVRNRLGVVDTTTSQSGRASPSGGSPIVLKP